MSEPVPDGRRPAAVPSRHLYPMASGGAVSGSAEPSAGLVLHRVLAHSARAFLLNDMGDEQISRTSRVGPVDPTWAWEDSGPLWAHSAGTSMASTQRRDDEAERIHQSRVALRRIRSNLRNFRLALDPAWGTALRAECSWYGNRLGHPRDLHILREVITVKGPGLMTEGEVAALTAVVDDQMVAALADITAERGGTRRFHLTEQMMLLWDGPAFKAKAARPAGEVLPAMLHRSWHDLRGAARAARRNPTDPNLHKLRIRLKELRYGAETVALIDGGPAKRVAKAAARLVGQLGDLHDACFSIEWFDYLASQRPELARPLSALVAAQRGTADGCRKGWRTELKVVERRWRKWQD